MQPAGRPLIISMLAVGIVSISTASIFIKLCHDAPPVVIAAARLGIASIVLIPGSMIFKGKRPLCIPSHHLKFIFLSALFLSLHFFFWITSLKHTSVLSSVVIVTSNPIFIGVASYLFFKERIHRFLLIGILLGLAGGILIALSDMHAGAGNSAYGDLMALGGAVMASCYFLVGRKVRKELDLLSYIVPVYALTSLLLLGLVIIFGHGFSGYSQSTYVYFVLLALIPQLLGHSSLNWSLKYVTATTVAVYVLGEPVCSSILAYFFLGEKATFLQVAGGLLILTGIFLAAKERTDTPDKIEGLSSGRTL